MSEFLTHAPESEVAPVRNNREALKDFASMFRFDADRLNNLLQNALRYPERLSDNLSQVQSTLRTMRENSLNLVKRDIHVPIIGILNEAESALLDLTSVADRPELQPERVWTLLSHVQEARGFGKGLEYSLQIQDTLEA